MREAEIKPSCLETTFYWIECRTKIRGIPKPEWNVERTFREKNFHELSYINDFGKNDALCFFQDDLGEGVALVRGENKGLFK